MQQKESKSNKHFQISLVKSTVRILAGISLVLGNIPLAGVALIIAELLGIAEEM